MDGPDQLRVGEAVDVRDISCQLSDGIWRLRGTSGGRGVVEDSRRDRNSASANAAVSAADFRNRTAACVLFRPASRTSPSSRPWSSASPCPDAVLRSSVSIYGALETPRQKG